MKYTARAPSNARVSAAESVWSATKGSAPALASCQPLLAAADSANFFAFSQQCLRNNLAGVSSRSQELHT